jgi:AraC-like DNA-binding protein
VSNDPFSDVLRLLEAKSVVSGGFAAGGTWAFRFPAPGQIVFSAIAKGACWLRLEGEKKAVRYEAGDVGLLSGRKGFILGSNPTARPTDVLFEDRNWGMDTIGDGSGCVVLAGRVSLHPSSAALLTEVLPERIHVRGSSPRAASLRWILDAILEERTSTLPGGNIASAQLAQLLFVQILRAHLASSAALPAGWLRAMADERLVRALRMMHEQPGRAWSLSELAKGAGMSRTRFAVHFSAVAGVAPLGYLAAWRMRLAQRILREENASIAQISESLGYASESAFSNAFKRITGVAPRNYRNAERREEPASSQGSPPPP